MGSDVGPDVGSDGVTVLWLPLGAGGHVVRRNGQAYEALCAWRERRRRLALVHAALLVDVDGRTWAVELAPAAGPGSGGPGVVATGPVGLRVLGRSRWFRYEVRRRPDGVVPDAASALVRRRLTADPRAARALLDAVDRVPLLVWGRDEAAAGEMWNSNSVVAWLVVRAGLDPAAADPPPGCRAPGWAAGLRVAARGGPQRLQAEPDV